MELPLWFIIILLLIICFLLYYLNNCLEVEAFGPNDNDEVGEKVTMDGIEDASAVKLSDDFFYFIKGAQVLQLDPDTTQSSESNSLEDINGYIFYSRQGNIKNVDKAGDAISVDSSVLDNNFSDYYKSQQIDPIAGNIINNQLFYIPFGNSTFIHVIEHPKLNHASGSETHTTFYSVHDDIQMKTHAYPITGSYSDIITKDPVTFTSGQVSNNYETAKVEFKGVDIHQIQPNVFYHYDSGTLLIKEEDTDNNNTFKLRMIRIPISTTLETEEFAGTDEAKLELKDKIPTSDSNINGFSFVNSYVYPDILGGNLILYLKNGAKTAICTLRRNSFGMFDLIGVVRFNGTQLNSYFGSGDQNVDGEEGEDEDIDGEGEENNEGSDEESDEESDDEEPEVPGSMDDYYKWYWYWNTSGSMPVHFSEDYMLKTQVVPPVCPACPSCPSGGNCNNCGGNGGSGTQDSNGKSMVNSKTGSELGGAYSKTLDTASDLLKSAGSGAKSIIDNTMGLSSQAVQGGVGLAKDTVQGATGLAKDTVQGGVGLAKDTVQGALNIGEDVLETGLDATGELARGTAGLIRDLGQGPSQLNNTYGSTGQGSLYNGSRGTYGAPIGSTYDAQSRSPLDPYTYNGKLKNRPSSEFLPRTADFSAFAK